MQLSVSCSLVLLLELETLLYVGLLLDSVSLELCHKWGWVDGSLDRRHADSYLLDLSLCLSYRIILDLHGWCSLPS